MKALLSATLILLGSRGLPASPLAPQRPPRLFGIVVGSNTAPERTVAPLRYADDDAAQNAELLRDLGAEVVLLTRFDADSARLYGELRATPPTHDAMQEAMRELNARISEVKRSGEKTVLYVMFSGHGDVENNEGFVFLEDSRWWRSDMLVLLASSAADANHLVIDACKSYFLVFDRGVTGSRQALRAPLTAATTQLPSNTGVFLSTSSAADSHEWEALQAGIFSHELRSALRGAADLDQDGFVSYEEAAAFIWEANSDVVNARFRPEVFARAPGGSTMADAALARLPWAAVDRLGVEPGPSEHYYIEDERGLRLAEFRAGENLAVSIVIPQRRPLFVVRPDSQREVELSGPSPLVVASSEGRPVTSRVRGAEHVAFKRLFSRPFDRASVVAYTEHSAASATESAPLSFDRVQRVLGAAAVGAGLSGGALTGLALRLRHTRAQDSGLARAHANQSIDRYNLGAISLYAVAGTALLGTLVWALWPSAPVEVMPATHAREGEARPNPEGLYPAVQP